MSKLCYVGYISAGKLIITGGTREQLKEDLHQLDGARVEIEIKKLPRRSIKQNGYYWSVVVAMVNKALRDIGHDVRPEDTHAFLKEKFNGEDICNGDGEVIGRIGGSTTLLNKPEMHEYIESIRRFASEYLGVVIPDPVTR